MPLLSAQGLTHAYRRAWQRRATSLVDVDLTLSAGQCWGLLGPNGSGKSTLLRLLAGLATPLAGNVTVLDHSAGTKGARRLTGYVPEAMQWPAALTVNDVLTELAAMSTSRDIVGRVDRVAELLDVVGLLGRRLGTLSLGQSRRVVLAQALLDDPPVLLLDEPFGGLDSLVLHRLRADLGLRLTAGAGIVLASHRVDDLARLCSHVMVLRDGRVVAAGPADDVLKDAGSEAGLATLLGGVP
ncbi:MAG: ABC-type multidrug transport system ATPase subunit [Pseudohongiellaceae bacterium]|jgi:ABC-type multidrug transport system ATPase subunit